MKPIYLLTLVVLAACTQQQAPTAATAPGEILADPAATAKVPAGDYTIDKFHASLVFRVSHLGFSHYTASFKKFDAQLKLDPANLTASSVTATIDPRSLDLNNPPEGFVETLIGKDWLNAAQFPEMSFKSTKVESTGKNTLRITGDFTLHGATKPVVLEATYNGGYPGLPQFDPHARIGFSAHGSLKRSDFGVSYGIPAPGSNMGVSDEVQITFEAEFSGPPLAAEQAK